MYKVVYAEGKYFKDTLEEFEPKVNELKSQGWIEQGGISISKPFDPSFGFYYIAQAMVKPEE